MAYTKEQKQQWYQVNKFRLNQRKQELRKLKRLGQDTSIAGQDKKVKTVNQVETNHGKEVKTSKLWSDYYSSKKPWCYFCIQQGIKNTEHKFCSSKQISPWNYACVVKHWTIYQGKEVKM